MFLSMLVSRSCFLMMSPFAFGCPGFKKQVFGMKGNGKKQLFADVMLGSVDFGVIFLAF